MATTTFMTLSLPVPSSTLGPAWATQLNTALERVDQHDHTSGNGAKITVPALDINTDLTFKNNNATNLKSTRFINNSAVLSGLQDIRSLYVSGGDLYYNNSSGTNIRITSGGALDASSIGGIGGDYATSSGSVFYTNASDLFTFDQATNTRANLDVGDVTVREPVASAEGITIESPTSLAASYNLTLFAAPPGSGTKIVTLDSSGDLGASYDVDDSTLEVSSDVLRVKDAGITTAKINDSAVTTAKLNDNAVTRAKLSNNIVSVSSDSGTFSTSVGSYQSTGISAAITPKSTNVLVILESSNNLDDFVINANAFIRIKRGATVIKETSNGTGLNAITFIDTGATAGSSNTYSIEIRSGSGTVTINCKMSLLEIL